MPDAMEELIEEAAVLIVESSFVVALAGAGLSAESGIPTFRGPGGLWGDNRRPNTNNYEAFLKDPAGWWEIQRQRQAAGEKDPLREAIDKAYPNPAHIALAEMEALGILKYTITQNVDGLQQKAGSRQVVEIHGSRTLYRCIDCESRWPRDGYVFSELPPRCPLCGGLIKHDTVMFGEPVPKKVLRQCNELVEWCDCMVLAGTSATVYPAAGFPKRVLERGGHVIEANPSATPISHLCDVVLRGPAGVVLPEIASRVRRHVKRRKSGT